MRLTKRATKRVTINSCFLWWQTFLSYKGSRRAVRLPALVVLLALLSWFGVAVAAGHGVPVRVTAAKMKPMAPQTWVAGTVVSRRQAHLATEVGGKLIRVAPLGAQVRENQIVARIDATFVKLKVEELAASVEREQAQLDFLNNEVRRNRRLANQNNSTQVDLDRLRADREVARNELRITRAQLKQARENLRRYVIRAPFAGVVMKRIMHGGEQAAVGDVVLMLVDNQDLEVQAWVPLATQNLVRSGDHLALKIDSQLLRAEVRSLAIANGDHSQPLDLRLATEGAGWQINQSVRIALPTSQPKTVLAVPRDALVLRGDSAYVFRVTPRNTVERLLVRPGITSGEWVAIKGDLVGGDRVVVRGAESLNPGSLVEVLGNADEGRTGEGDALSPRPLLSPAQ